MSGVTEISLHEGNSIRLDGVISYEDRMYIVNSAVMFETVSVVFSGSIPNNAIKLTSSIVPGSDPNLNMKQYYLTYIDDNANTSQSPAGLDIFTINVVSTISIAGSSVTSQNYYTFNVTSIDNDIKIPEDKKEQLSKSSGGLVWHSRGTPESPAKNFLNTSDSWFDVIMDAVAKAAKLAGQSYAAALAETSKKLETVNTYGSDLITTLSDLLTGKISVRDALSFIDGRSKYFQDEALKETDWDCGFECTNNPMKVDASSKASSVEGAVVEGVLAVGIGVSLHKDGYYTVQVTSGKKFIGSSAADALYAGSTGRKLDGGVGDDFLVGGSGNDKIKGGKGSDIISASGGKDKVWGQGGRDIFEFTKQFKKVIVKDFKKGDKIVVGDSIFAGTAQDLKKVVSSYKDGAKIDLGSSGKIMLPDASPSKIKKALALVDIDA